MAMASWMFLLIAKLVSFAKRASKMGIFLNLRELPNLRTALARASGSGSASASVSSVR